MKERDDLSEAVLCSQLSGLGNVRSDSPQDLEKGKETMNSAII